MRLLEYDFTVHYRKGLKNQNADAVSRLATVGETKIAPGMEIPCYFIEGLNSHIEAASDCFHTALDYEPEDEVSSLD